MQLDAHGSDGLDDTHNCTDSTALLCLRALLPGSLLSAHCSLLTAHCSLIHANLSALKSILNSTQTTQFTTISGEVFVSLKGKIMFKRSSSFIFALALLVTVGLSTASAKDAEAVRVPLNIAILIQDNLTSQVANEIGVTKEFIRSLPAGSRVMVGYITAGRLQVRQSFTTDLNRAANSLRIPMASTAASSFNPYVEVIDALKKFDPSWRGNNAVLLISDGLDVSRGFDATAAGNTLDIDRTIKEANRRDVSIYSFYAPSVGLTSRNRLAASYGQSSLQRVSDETGGRAFFQGVSGFVTFDSHFRRLREELNRHYSS